MTLKYDPARRFTIELADVEQVNLSTAVLTVVAHDAVDDEAYEMQMFVEHRDKEIETADRRALNELLNACDASGAGDSSKMLGKTITRFAWAAITRLIQVGRPQKKIPPQRRGREPEGAKYVYVISCTDSPDPLCKIGIAASPEQRLKSLSTSSPHSLRLETAVHTPFARQIEAAAHHHFAEYRRNGEWFGMPPHPAVEYVHQTIGSAA